MATVVASAVLALLGIAPASAAGEPRGDEGGGPESSQLERVVADAVAEGRAVARSRSESAQQEAVAYYRATDGISLDEARRLARLVEEARSLQEGLTEGFSAQFGGLYLDHETRAITVAWLGDPTALSSLLPTSDYTVTSAAYSERDLEAAATEVARQMRAARVAADVEVDISRNAVIVSVVPGSVEPARAVLESPTQVQIGPDSALATRDQATPEDLQAPGIELVTVPSLAAPAATLYGGMASSPTCTWGLSGRNSAGNPVLIMAGHCGDTQSIAGVPATFVHGRQYGYYDVQFHSVPTSHTVRPWIYDGIAGDSTPYYRVVTGTRGRGAIVIGEGMCKRGKTTGYTCGTVSSKIIAPSYIANANATFIRTTSTTTDQSEPGDSGGPVFIESLAAGIVSGHYESNFDMIFMSTTYISSAGYSVMVN